MNDKRKTYYLIDNSTQCPCDSEQLEDLKEGLKKDGWKQKRDIRKAEIIIMKFCCITAEEIKEDINIIKKTIKTVGKGRIFIGFCMAKSEQIRQAIIKCLPGHDLNFFKSTDEFFELLNINVEKHEMLTLRNDIPIINITYGCMRSCAFCKVAYVKNTFRSVPQEEIISKVMLAKKKGKKLVVISAMNATEYSYNGRNLTDLLKALLAIPGMLYQLNGLVLCELTQEMIDIIRNPRFYHIQLEVQSFIPEVRKNMLIGTMPEERILEILNCFKGKGISSCIMIGCEGEKALSFKKQIELIKENDLYYLTVDPLVKTPGTKCASMRNVPSKIMAKREIELSRVLLDLKVKKARKCLGKKFKGVVINKPSKVDGSTIILVDTGVLVRDFRQGVSIGDIVETTPMYVESLIAGENQAVTLSTKETKGSKLIEKIKKDILSKPLKSNAPEDLKIRTKIANAISPDEFLFDIMEGKERAVNDTVNKGNSLYDFVIKQFN